MMVHRTPSAVFKTFEFKYHFPVTSMQTSNVVEYFAMKDWHLDHVEKVIVRYIKGISPYPSPLEKRNFKKYSTIFACAKQIEYDVRHGVTTDEILSVIRKIRYDKEFPEFQSNHEIMQRFAELERQFSTLNKC